MRAEEAAVHGIDEQAAQGAAPLADDFEKFVASFQISKDESVKISSRLYAVLI